MSPTVWFLTGNAGKLVEATNHLSHLGYVVKQLVVEGNQLYEPQAETLEIVAKSAWKLLELTVSLPFERENITFSPSGKDLQSSDIFLAETVVSPSS